MDVRDGTTSVLSGPPAPVGWKRLGQWIAALWPGQAGPLSKARIRPGLYHYVRESDGTFTRFHLRVDSTGSGLLLANSSAAAQLRPSGVIIAKGLLDGDSEAAIVGRLRASFRGATPQQAAADVARVRQIIATLDSPGDNYPIVNLADPSFAPKASPWDRPLSADVPLAGPELLVAILDRLWELAIPHVTLIAGPRPDAPSLVRAVERAEDLGLIAGVRALGSDLIQGTLINDLAQAGVDHVDVLYLSAEAKVHDALAGAGDHAAAVRAIGETRRNEVCPVAEIALVESTLAGIHATLRSLHAQGVTNAGFFAVAMAEGKSSGGALAGDDLVEAARLVEESAEQSQVRYLWYAPVRAHLGKSLAKQVCRGPRTRGDHSVRVEPDGSVIPARGRCLVAGNLLSDDWDTIRRSEVYRNYRRRIEADTQCDDCPGLAICAADCPREPAGWADARKVSENAE